MLVIRLIIKLKHKKNVTKSEFITKCNLKWIIGNKLKIIYF